MRIFLITGAAIGVVGTLVGFLLGIAGLPQHRVDPPVPVVAHQHRAVLARALFPLASCRPTWTSGETTAVVVMALALSFLATLYPSWRAARLDPVEALRYE